MDAPELRNSFSTYQVIGLIVVFIILGGILSYSNHVFAIDFSSLFHNPNLSSIDERSGVSQPAPVEQKDVPMGPGKKTAALSEMYWCLIGEDMAGRWCVQVQDEKNCDKDRTFKSKNECEQLYPKK